MECIASTNLKGSSVILSIVWARIIFIFILKKSISLERFNLNVTFIQASVEDYHSILTNVIYPISYKFKIVLYDSMLSGKMG